MQISKHNTINKFVNKNILSPDPWITAFEDAQNLTEKKTHTFWKFVCRLFYYL